MDRILGLPAKYVQGPGALDRLGVVAAALGPSALIFSDHIVRDLVETQVTQSLEAAKLPFLWEKFGGECCRPEIDRLCAIGKAGNMQVVVALGGGKALDTGKAVAAAMGFPFLSVPTIASTDGPVSSIAIEYTEDHKHIGVMKFNCCPSTVLVDTQIVADAPVRLLVAGMGDGLATWFEARSCHTSGITNFLGGAISDVAMTLAKSCYDTIITYGRDAVKAATQGKVDKAVERVVEANVLLSGVGFENTGVAGAHALDAAISRMGTEHSSHHGERVALGILFQLILEGDATAIGDLRSFYADVGLPANFADLGMGHLTQDDLRGLAKLVLRDGSPIRNLPFEVSEGDVTRALARFL